MFLKKTPPKDKSVVREYVEAILIALVLALFIRSFIVQAFKIPSGSMEPTLLIGDHLLVNKFLYGVKNPFTGATWIPYKNPQRSDIVVFKYPVNPKQDFIKRVVGVEGDRIKIVNKELYVNDQPYYVEGAVHLDPDIIPGRINSRDNMAEITVPKNSLFVMGDNRDNSHDSRFWKFVKLKNIKGKAFILYWSWNKDKFSVRFDRLFNIIR
nr:signal peptidase I [Desulfobulbaceae bacterium]